MLFCLCMINLFLQHISLNFQMSLGGNNYAQIGLGSRRSKLALTQSQQFIDKLKAVDPTLEIEIKEIVTKGDRIVNKQLSKVGGKDYLLKKSNKNF